MSEQLLEIRYRPNPRVIDFRGTWAQQISEYMNLSEWRIIQDRIDVNDKPELIRAFVGFRNAGLIVRNATTDNYFSDQARKLFRFLFESYKDDFGVKIHVERFGVRSKTIVPFDGDMRELVKRYSSKYMQLTPGAALSIGAEIVDIGGPVNFKDEFGTFNTTSGPVTQAEGERLLTFKELKDSSYPKVGLYVDVDYWRTPHDFYSKSEVLDLIRTFTTQTLVRQKQICELVLGD